MEVESSDKESELTELKQADFFFRPTWDCEFVTPIKTPQHIHYDRIYSKISTLGVIVNW